MYWTWVALVWTYWPLSWFFWTYWPKLRVCSSKLIFFLNLYYPFLHYTKYKLISTYFHTIAEFEHIFCVFELYFSVVELICLNYHVVWVETWKANGIFFLSQLSWFNLFVKTTYSICEVNQDISFVYYISKRLCKEMNAFIGGKLNFFWHFGGFI